MRLVRMDVMCALPTFCGKDPMALVGCLFQSGGSFEVRKAIVPMRAMNLCGPNVEEIQDEIGTHGALCPEALARVWFPELEGLPYGRQFLSIVG